VLVRRDAGLNVLMLACLLIQFVNDCGYGRIPV
jgi:hypothetical protein